MDQAKPGRDIDLFAGESWPYCLDGRNQNGYCYQNLHRLLRHPEQPDRPEQKSERMTNGECRYYFEQLFHAMAAASKFCPTPVTIDQGRWQKKDKQEQQVICALSDVLDAKGHHVLEAGPPSLVRQIDHQRVDY